MSERIKAQTYVKRDWQWGDVAMVTARGVTRPAVKGALHGWYGPGGYLSDDDVTDARPLAVIDYEDREAVDRLNGFYCAKRSDGELQIHALQAALREFANPTPPKPPEPLGLGAVVEDARGVRWVRTESAMGMTTPWSATLHHLEPDTVRQFAYADIDAVRVLSEGVTAHG